MTKRQKTAQTAPTVITKKPITVPAIKLGPTQERIAEILAEALTNGGSETAIDSLLYVAGVIEYEERFGDRDKEDTKSRDAIAARFAEEFKPLLLREILETAQAHTAEATAATLVARYRQSLRSRLRTSLEDFLVKADPSDLHFLADVFVTCQSCGNGSPYEMVEAFGIEVNREFVMVASKHREAVESYARALEAKERAA